MRFLICENLRNLWFHKMQKAAAKIRNRFFW